MLTDEQIQWLVPVFNTAYSILDRIGDLNPAHKRGCRVDGKYFSKKDCDYEFFYDKDCGLLKVLYLEYNSKHYIIFGKTKKEIVWHIVDNIIIDEHLLYADLRVTEECEKKNLDEDLHFWPLFLYYANNRLEHHYGIADSYLKNMEDSILPPDGNQKESFTRTESRRDCFNVRIIEDKINVYVALFHLHYYSCCKLHLYNKNHDEIESFLIDKPHSLIDITSSFSEIEYISLTADNEMLGEQYPKDYFDYNEFLKVIEKK
jgi:hypothetical protein